jgi:hypothetical protein
VTAGVARGLTRSSDPRTDGDTRFYFRTGSPSRDIIFLGGRSPRG